MIVAVLLTVLGLLLGIMIVQVTGLRLSGVLVVPMLAVYGLFELYAVPVLLASAAVTYVVLAVLEHRTLLIGRELLVASLLVSLSIPILLGSILALLGGGGLPLVEISSMGSLLSGVAAYNYRQLDKKQRLEDVAVSLGGFFGLFMLGGLLIRPELAPTLGTEFPLLLFSSESDVALLRGAAIEDRTPGFLSPFVIYPALVGGLLLTEGVYKRWGIRLLGTIIFPLLALFALRNVIYLGFYLALLPVAFFAVVIFHRRTLLYGRVLLALSISIALLVVPILASVFDQLSGFHCYFVAVFAGIGAYNLHRLSPVDRPHSLSLSGSLFVIFLGAFGTVVTPRPEGIAITTGLLEAVVSLCVLAIGWYSAFMFEQRRIQPTDRSSLLDRLRGEIGGTAEKTAAASQTTERVSAVDYDGTARTADGTASAGRMAVGEPSGVDSHADEQAQSVTQDGESVEPTESPGDAQPADQSESSRPATPRTATDVRTGGSDPGVDTHTDAENRNRIEAGGAVFTLVDQFHSTDRFSSVTLYEVRQGQEKLGYSVILGWLNSTLLMLDETGTQTAAPLTPQQFIGNEPGGSVEEMAVFETEQAAREAYFSGESTVTDQSESTELESNWLASQEIVQLEKGWVLSVQEGSDRRYCLTRSTESGSSLEVLTSAGSVGEFDATASVSTLPAFDSEAAARSAHRTWVENRTKSTDQAQPPSTEWKAVDQLPPWYVSRRTQNRDDSQRFERSGTRAPGDEDRKALESHSSETAGSKAMTAPSEQTETGNRSDDGSPPRGRPSKKAVGTARTERTQSQTNKPNGSLANAREQITGSPTVSVSTALLFLAVYRRLKRVLGISSPKESREMPDDIPAGGINDG